MIVRVRGSLQPPVVGAVAEIVRAFSLEEVVRFAELTGDSNPVHQDEAFAAGTQFKRRIVHGLLYGSLFGTIFGTQIPGCVYVSQQFQFRRPVYLDEEVIAQITVTAVRNAPKQLVTCATTIRRTAGGELCMDGEARVLLPPILHEDRRLQ